MFTIIIYLFSININNILQLSMYGGQYFLDNSPQSFTGNASLLYAANINTKSYTLIPMYYGRFRGIRDIKELIGGGVLTRQELTNSASIRFVKGRKIKYKATASYSVGYIKETNDEAFGKGLFDNARILAGFELEKSKYRVGFDFYSIRYPNYTSLISKSQTIIDTETYKELSSNAGKDVLDNTNIRFFFEYSTKLMGVLRKIGFDFTLRDFPQQSIVNNVGGFKSEKRKDIIFNLFGSYSVTFTKYSAFLIDLRTTMLSSNQNSYDASRTRFIENFYSYYEVGVTPLLNILPKNSHVLGLSVGYVFRSYSGRIAQTQDGSYTSDKIYSSSFITSISYKIPVYSKLYWVFNFSSNNTSSNMKFEQTYRYNYGSYVYHTGLEYEI